MLILKPVSFKVVSRMFGNKEEMLIKFDALGHTSGVRGDVNVLIFHLEVSSLARFAWHIDSINGAKHSPPSLVSGAPFGQNLRVIDIL